MATKTSFWIFISCLFACFSCVFTVEYCFVEGNIKYCQYGCCDNACCSISTEAIVGMVIGGIMALVAVVSCIVCIACLCKSHSQRGSNVQPYHNSNAVYVTSFGHPPPQAPPPAYGQYNHFPTAGGSRTYNNDSAYPPGFVHPPPYTAGKT